ncbi:MAG: UbiX family flavin prenyltransferase [Ginsengibacter sp.]
MHKIVIAITGASGAIYPKLLLDKLLSIKEQWRELSIVMTENARNVWETELENKDFINYGINIYNQKDFTAPFASGSARYNIMIVAPCSMGTLGRIATGISADLISRAADVILKERRKLILVVRETPYNLIHLQNMERVTLAGGIICPATPSFYSKPKTIEEAALTVVDRIMDLAGLQINTYRWGTKG